MTIEEKNAAIEKYCDNNGCNGCPLYSEIPIDKSCFGEDADIERNFSILFPTVVSVEHDPVNHPSHYTDGGMECIDEMRMIFGRKATMHFCLCNAWKYRRRAMYKNGEEDMQKSHWYLAKYKELKGDD